MSVKLWVVPEVLPVSVELNAPLFVPYRTTPVALKSVEKAIIVLVEPERELLILDASDTRFMRIEVDPVFPARSVARAVIVLSPPVRLLRVFDQVFHERVAALPLRSTLATPQESVTVPENVGEPLTRAQLECDVIATIGAIISPIFVV